MNTKRNPRTISTRQVGILTLLEEVAGIPLSHLLWQSAGEVKAICEEYARCCQQAPDFYVFVRESLDRLQQECALSVSGTIVHVAGVSELQYAATTDVMLDRDDRLDILRRLLEHVGALLAEKDPKKALKRGMDPVPIYFEGHSWKSRSFVAESSGPRA